MTDQFNPRYSLIKQIPVLEGYIKNQPAETKEAMLAYLRNPFVFEAKTQYPDGTVYHRASRFALGLNTEKNAPGVGIQAVGVDTDFVTRYTLLDILNGITAENQYGNREQITYLGRLDELDPPARRTGLFSLEISMLGGDVEG